MPEVPKVLGLDQIPPVDDVMSSAMAAFARGNATPNQQKLVFKYILQDVCGLTAYSSSRLNERESGFTDGKRFVGIVLSQISGAEVYRWAKEE